MIQQLDLTGPLRLAKPVTTAGEDAKERLTLGQLTQNLEKGSVDIEQMKQELSDARMRAQKAVQVNQILSSGKPPEEIHRALTAVDPAQADAYRAKVNAENATLFPKEQQTSEISMGADPLNPQQDYTVAAPARPQPFLTMGGKTEQLPTRSARDVLEEKFNEVRRTKNLESTNRIAEKAAEQAGNMMEIPIDIPELGITKGQKVPKDWGDNLMTLAGTLRKPKTETRSNLQRDTMVVNGKPEDVLVGVDPSDTATFQKVFLRGADVTAKASHYEKPSASLESGNQDIKDLARGIMEGKISPIISQSVSFRDRTPVGAELARLGYDQAAAERDFKAVNKHLSTLNGSQQERLRQAITFVDETIPQIEEAYAEWKKQAGISGFKILNHAAQKSMAQLPGKAGSAAAQLDSLIADFTSELGTVYKGGNSSTDEALKLAAQNLKGDWNEQTFSDAIKRLKKSVQLRKNSISASDTAGISPSVYEPSRAKDPLGIR